MKHKLYIFCILVFTTICIESCTQDFIEPNISNKSIQLMAPGNGIHSSVETQTFWWNALTGAEQYDLQIVQGTFASPIQLILDTTISNNKYTFSLLPGTYQWRVEGKNNGYNTPFSAPYTLTIDTNTNMSTQIVILVSPANNIWSNTLINTYKWDSLAGATSYRLQITNQSTSIMVVDTNVKREPFTISLPADGKYTWQVRAQNSSSNSAYSAYSLGIDTTTPNTPVLLTPKDDSTTSSTHFTLTWSIGAVSFSPVRDSVYIYSNNSMTTIIKDTLTSLTSFSDTLTAGTYYWRVRSFDAAGNKSSYSTLFNFTTP